MQRFLTGSHLHAKALSRDWITCRSFYDHFGDTELAVGRNLVCDSRFPYYFPRPCTSETRCDYSKGEKVP